MSDNTKSEQKSAKAKKKMSKKKLAIIISACAVVVVAAAVLVVVFVLPSFGIFPGLGATPDGAYPDVVIDKDTFVFADRDIYVGKTNLRGLTYSQAQQAVDAEAAESVKAFDLTVSASGKEFTYNKDSFEWDYNTDSALKLAANYSAFITDHPVAEDTVKKFELAFSVNADSVGTVVAEIAQEVDVPAKNATISDATDSSVTIENEVIGHETDRADLVTKITSAVTDMAQGKSAKMTIIAVIKEVQPEVKHDDINENVKLLASWESYSYNTADGDHNMELALSKCNGSVIEPGDVWSFNACTGDSNLTSNGYRGATVIVNGKFVQGVGGGICQACTTIYNAAIRANLDIVERYNHYYQSSYCDVGLDATIDYPALDLKLKNTTEYPVYLQCYMSDATLYCNIYGWQDPSFDEIKVESFSHSANKAQNYYLASATRIFYLNGVEVDREELPSSRYHYNDGSVQPTTVKPTTTKPKPTTPEPKPTKPPETVPPVTTDPTEAYTDVPVETTIAFY